MTPGELARLGWDEAWADLFAPYGAAGLVPGRVSLEHNHVYRVLTREGEWLAEAAGRMRHRAADRRDLPAVGDWVAVRPEAQDNRRHIRAVLPRRTWFSRKMVGRETREQVLAANVDTVFLVAGLDVPVKPRALERYLALARQSGARPVIVLNKVDLAADPAAARADAVAVAGSTPVKLVSGRQATTLEPLRPWLKAGETVALLGPSGSGKSTLINALLGEERLPTGEVREADARGRHTSVHRQLLVLPAGGVLVDTPGMRELQLWEASAAVVDTFDDIRDLARGCRFRDCQHDREPGCAVRLAVERGELSGARLDGFHKLAHEESALAARQAEQGWLPEGAGRAAGPPTRSRRRRR